MATYKLYHRKKRYAHEMKKSSSIPTWVIMKTNRKVRSKLYRRHWRSSKIKR